VNGLVALKDGFAFVTGDGAAAYTTGGPAREATYTSKVFDAQFPARWGNLRWRGEGALVLETRSGNTSKPDRGWSAWQKPGAPSRGSGGATVARVASPPGRYLQYRVSWNGQTGALREVAVYYLPQNQRVRVTEIAVGEAGDPNKRPPVTTQGGAAKPRSPLVKIKWKVDNPDEDELVYKVEYRADGDVDWRPLPTGDAPLTKAEVEWNTEPLPDGYYRLRVTASDERSNPRDVALEHAYTSQPFLIDNQKPQVVGVEVRGGWASGRAVDSFSRIDEIAWSIDGGDWAIAYPKDGIFDDVAEMFTLKLPADLKPGAHMLSIRVADEADNIGATTVTFRIGK
jgi:hypothetical protein